MKIACVVLTVMVCALGCKTQRDSSSGLRQDSTGSGSGSLVKSIGKLSLSALNGPSKVSRQCLAIDGNRIAWKVCNPKAENFEGFVHMGNGGVYSFKALQDASKELFYNLDSIESNAAQNAALLPTEASGLSKEFTKQTGLTAGVMRGNECWETFTLAAKTNTHCIAPPAASGPNGAVLVPIKHNENECAKFERLVINMKDEPSVCRSTAPQGQNQTPVHSNQG